MAPLQRFLGRFEALENHLTRRENMIRFLIGRLLLMVLMLAGFAASFHFL